jgi:ABC-type multidrug transport system permease subunit
MYVLLLSFLEPQLIKDISPITPVRTLNVPCASLVPSGPAYPGVAIANQVCSVAGSRTGSDIVIGADYLLATFGYSYSHTWRNLGIV